MYERIVVPLDGSDLASRALPEAERLARLVDAPLHLVRVVDLANLQRVGYLGLAAEYAAYQQVLEDEKAAAQEYLAGAERDMTERGIRVSTELRHGAAARELLAATRPGDLIVMASHGRTGVPRWFLGSVAEELTRHATVPVLLVRAANFAGPEPDAAVPLKAVGAAR